MRKIFLITLVFLAQIFFAQTAAQIIDKNIQNTGGLVQWKLLNTILLQGKVILGVNEEYPVKIYQARPNLTKTIVVNGKKEQVIEGYDGKKGYAMNYAVNKLQEYPNYKPESFDTDFINYEQKGFTAELLGVEKLGDKEVFKVELRGETITYSDYKKVGNLLMPFRIEASSPKKDSDYVMIFSKIELNKAFKDDTFKF